MARPISPAGHERILLVDDSATQALRTRWVLESAGFEVHVCENGTMALAAAAEEEPDLVLLDMYLPDLSGREVARRLKADPTLSGIPVIFLTGVFRDVADIITGLDQGADDYLRKPVEDGELVARVRASLRAKTTQRELGRLARLLLAVNQVGSQLAGILDLDGLLTAVVELMRSNFDYPHVLLYLMEDNQLVVRAAAGTMAAELLATAPRVALDSDNLAASAARTSQIMAPTESHGILHPLLTDVLSGAAAPVISGGAVSGVLEIASPAAMAFAANDVLVLQTLANMLGVAAQNSRLYRRMEELAMVDDLTGLLNRRTLVARLTAEWDRCQRFKHRLGLVVVDVDHFKEVNDSYGHHSGDRALMALAKLIQGAIRRVDSAGRLGGDEFLLILPETSQVGALEVARRMGQAGHLLLLGDDTQQSIAVTLSLGVASWPDTPATAAADLLRAADEALYRAKTAGRNRIST